MRRALPVLVGLAVAAVCGRLGLWQLDRLEQRQARNAVLEGRLAMPALDLPADRDTEADADVLHFRRATAAGSGS